MTSCFTSIPYYLHTSLLALISRLVLILLSSACTSISSASGPAMYLPSIAPFLLSMFCTSFILIFRLVVPDGLVRSNASRPYRRSYVLCIINVTEKNSAMRNAFIVHVQNMQHVSWQVNMVNFNNTRYRPSERVMVNDNLCNVCFGVTIGIKHFIEWYKPIEILMLMLKCMINEGLYSNCWS